MVTQAFFTVVVMTDTDSSKTGDRANGNIVFRVTFCGRTVISAPVILCVLAFWRENNLSEQSDNLGRGRGRIRRPVNIPVLKRTIVLLAGGVTGLGSVLTGLGAQLAFAPMLNWMLGFAPDKAQGTALRYALYVALMGLVGAMTAKSGMCLLLPGCLLLFLSATTGAILTNRFTPAPQNFRMRRIFQVGGIAVTLLTILNITQRNAFNMSYGFAGSPPLTLVLFGLATGALSQVLSLPGGLLLIPALVFWGGYHAREAVLLALGMVLLASLLPTWGYGKRGLIDRFYGDAAIIGGMVGAFGGGMLLMRLGSGERGDKIIMTLSAAVAMFLCGRELARLLTTEPTPAPKS